MRVAATALAVLLFGACAKGADENVAHPAAPSVPAAAEIQLSNPSLRFTYLAKDGKFAMAQRASDVPKEGRGAVMVVDLAQTRSETDAVWVVDLRAEPPMDKVAAKAMDRSAFERLARGFVDAARPPVTMYATSWCGVCRRARGWLSQQGVRYRELDVEKDPKAAAELREKAQKAGVEARGVPVFDVAGRILPGFDEATLKQLLKL